MSPIQTQQLHRITVRWAQAHRKQDLLDWHSLTGMLMDMARSAVRIADNATDMDFAGDLYALAGLSYFRSVEYMPPDLCRLPNLIYATA